MTVEEEEEDTTTPLLRISNPPHRHHFPSSTTTSGTPTTPPLLLSSSSSSSSFSSAAAFPSTSSSNTNPYRDQQQCEQPKQAEMLPNCCSCRFRCCSSWKFTTASFCQRRRQQQQLEIPKIERRTTTTTTTTMRMSSRSAVAIASSFPTVVGIHLNCFFAPASSSLPHILLLLLPYLFILFLRSITPSSAVVCSRSSTRRFFSICCFMLFSFAAPIASAANNQHCDLAKAEGCFAQLFEHLPICSAHDYSGELAFRCQHFNVLDICFGDNQIRCLPTAIGTAAKTAYQKRVDACLYANKAAAAATEQDKQEKLQQSGNVAGSSHRHHHAQRIHPGPMVGLLAPPSELQFISLFGYLQTQCRPRRRSPGSADRGGGGGNRRSHFRSGESGGPSSNGGGSSSNTMQTNCSEMYYMDEVMGACENEMTNRQPSTQMRHKLLRLKLDASHQLLRFPETRPDDECLMVRSVLSDIFLIHQKHCFHTTVTRCLCEQMDFERTCGIQCANLEAFGLPLNRELLWIDFRGRLSSAHRSVAGSIGMIAMCLLAWCLAMAMWIAQQRQNVF